MSKIKKKISQTCDQVYRQTGKFYRSIRTNLKKANADRSYKILYAPPVYRPDILFLGYQPGYRPGKGKNRIVKPQATWPKKSEYASKNWTLAKKLRKIFRQNQLSSCAGLNLIFFRARTVKAWKKVNKPLRGKIEKFCLRKVKKLVKELNPKRIVVIGLETKDKLQKQHAFGKVRKPIKGNPSNRVLAVKGNLWNVPACAVVHLTGARISKTNFAKVRKVLRKFVK